MKTRSQCFLVPEAPHREGMLSSSQSGCAWCWVWGLQWLSLVQTHPWSAHSERASLMTKHVDLYRKFWVAQKLLPTIVWLKKQHRPQQSTKTVLHLSLRKALRAQRCFQDSNALSHLACPCAGTVCLLPAPASLNISAHQPSLEQFPGQASNQYLFARRFPASSNNNLDSEMYIF